MSRLLTCDGRVSVQRLKDCVKTLVVKAGFVDGGAYPRARKIARRQTGQTLLERAALGRPECAAHFQQERKRIDGLPVPPAASPGLQNRDPVLSALYRATSDEFVVLVAFLHDEIR